jgi:hypothetical protein
MKKPTKTVPTGYRLGAPRTGDTILIGLAGESREVTVTQVLMRTVRTLGQTSVVHGVRTLTAGFSGFSRGPMHYLIKEG